MDGFLTRRSAVLGALALAACAPKPASLLFDPLEPAGRRDEPRFAAIERRIGGRLGVAAWNTATDAWLTHRAHERFAMCSVFKWLLAAQMLWIEERTPGFLDRQARFDEAYLAPLGYTPVTTANLERGWMTIGELAEAAVAQSDNGAANLLLERAMGPEGFTRFLRAHGDPVTRLDRIEPALNENLPGDERDTTTPDAMARTLVRFLTADQVLSAASRDVLIGWLVACQTGLSRLRAGLPQGWRAGDKTGTSVGDNNATTDVAIAWPPGRAPIVIACFLSHSTVELDARNAAHAEVARIVAETWS
ncbi:MAG TPA: class A beta-lactamase [Gammaproteobacteria bacterium]